MLQCLALLCACVLVSHMKEGLSVNSMTQNGCMHVSCTIFRHDTAVNGAGCGGQQSHLKFEGWALLEDWAALQAHASAV